MSSSSIGGACAAARVVATVVAVASLACSVPPPRQAGTQELHGSRLAKAMISDSEALNAPRPPPPPLPVDTEPADEGPVADEQLELEGEPLDEAGEPPVIELDETPVVELDEPEVIELDDPPASVAEEDVPRERPDLREGAKAKASPPKR